MASGSISPAIHAICVGSQLLPRWAGRALREDMGEDMGLPVVFSLVGFPTDSSNLQGNSSGVDRSNIPRRRGKVMNTSIEVF